MLPLIALVASGIVLLGISIATARRPEEPIPDFEGYLGRWSQLHGNYDPRGSFMLRGWLELTFWVGRPLARRGIMPDVLTIWSVWFAFAVFVPAQAGGRWPILAGWLLVFSGFGDTLDGCVAALTNRATRWGYVLDSVVDRINDVIYLFAVWSVGGPAGLAIAAGCAFGLLEYLRARAGNAGMGEIGVVTVGERATRVILCSASIHFGGVFVERSELIATVGLAALAVLSVVAVVQLAVSVRRALLAPSMPSQSGRADEAGDDRG